MRSLRADLAAAGRDQQTQEAPSARDDDPRSRSREQVSRADAAVNEFRARVRSDLRAHVARGGDLAADVVDDLAAQLDRIARDISRTLRS